MLLEGIVKTAYLKSVRSQLSVSLSVYLSLQPKILQNATRRHCQNSIFEKRAISAICESMSLPFFAARNLAECYSKALSKQHIWKACDLSYLWVYEFTFLCSQKSCRMLLEGIVKTAYLKNARSSYLLHALTLDKVFVFQYKGIYIHDNIRSHWTRRYKMINFWYI